MSSAGPLFPRNAHEAIDPGHAIAGPVAPPTDSPQGRQLAQLATWVEARWLREVDQAFAAFLAREAPDANPLLLLAAALASHQLGRGHACLDLHSALEDASETLALPPEQGDATLEGAMPTPGERLAGLGLADWQAALRHPRLVGDGPGNTPLVLEATRLYLRRYWQYERSVREGIGQRLAAGDALPASEQALLRPVLDALFPQQALSSDGVDWQKVACALAARSSFSIVTGGPGTGKTTTVVKLLAVLQGLAMAGGPRLRIRLAAPTGKAAARLNESIAGAVSNLPVDAIVAVLAQGGSPAADAADNLRAAIPTDVTTVHRLLGSRPDTRRFRHDARNRLPLDVLVLDEASMVDLEMMASVLAALPPKARLILLGDKDQLSSVEAGAVLGALCCHADAGRYTPATSDWLLAATGQTLPAERVDPQGGPLDQAVVKLRHSHRFDANSGIGRLAQAVNDGDMAAVRALRSARHADLAFLTMAGDDDAALRRLALDGGGPADGAPRGLRHTLDRMRKERPEADAGQDAFDHWAGLVLKTLSEFQLLCAVRAGPAGVDQLNARVAGLLQAEGLTSAARGWYAGRPVMVTRNDYALGLMNGDVGITLAVPQTATERGPSADLLRVAFADGRQGIRWVLPSRLRAVETVYAMTVHKSQGSEFRHAALVLPNRVNRVLTRELVYTAVTRAREAFTLVTFDGGAGVLEQAVTRRVLRAGGGLV